MKYTILFTLLAGLGISAFSETTPEKTHPSTHSAALYEGKYGTSGHAALHRGNPKPQDQLSFGFVSLWESKYVSEGRNNLDDGGLFSLEAVMEWDGLVGGVWFAVGDDEDYQEVNAFIEYGTAVGPVDLSVGYARLEFLKDYEEDNEFAAGAALNNIPYIIPSIDYVYSTEADGGFLEVTLQSEFSFFDEKFILEPYMLQAFDFGFVTDSHDGRNNFQVGIAASLSLTETFALVGSASHSWAQDDIEQEGDDDDLSWGAIGVAAAF
jgi:hypothetical protein